MSNEQDVALGRGRYGGAILVGAQSGQPVRFEAVRAGRSGWSVGKVVGTAMTRNAC